MPRYLGQGAAEKLGRLAGLPPEEREVVAYGLDYLLSGVIGLALMLLIGLALGLFGEALVVVACWTSMRVFAGGAHCTARWRCTIVNCMGMCAALLLTWFAVNLLAPAAWAGAAAAWALLAVGFWAPNNSERPVSDPLRRRRLRRRALLVVVFLGAALLYAGLGGAAHWQTLAAAGATGLAAGGFMISPAAFRLIGWLDRKLEHLGRSLTERR